MQNRLDESIHMSRATGSASYLRGPCRGELIAVVAAGTTHVLAEVFFSEAVALVITLLIVLVFAGYLLWRLIRTPGVLRAWGFRSDNFRPAFAAQLAFAAVGVVVLFAIGYALGPVGLPRSFWLTLALYPLWGLAQQFALQNMIARNLEGWLASPVAIAVAAAALFAASHFPRLDLVALTAAAGVFLTLIYRRFPNLWAVGIVHGILGSVAIYVVVREDPGAAILGWLSRG
jgi:membrane protease YdiL (CAAX protease family)